MSVLVRDFGAAVRRLREASGWSQEQLAEHAGLNRSYVGEIERGSAIASIVTLDKLARAFNVPVERLLCHSSGNVDVAALSHSAAVDQASAL
ncbi:helix-turn-helix domain-containing protein [Paraburkholderia caffeinilytica]|uniref:helix-turn-helix domain-containing protein n=1 Tax=Paraburkholderia caffeinilytica TaxID=1761016 RepID=UPI003DA185F1